MCCFLDEFVSIQDMFPKKAIKEKPDYSLADFQGVASSDSNAIKEALLSKRQAQRSAFMPPSVSVTRSP